MLHNKVKVIQKHFNIYIIGIAFAFKGKSSCLMDLRLI